MATKKQPTPSQEPAERKALLDRLGIDPTSDTGKWMQQQQEAGVKDADILAALASGNVTPSPFKPRERVA